MNCSEDGNITIEGCPNATEDYGSSSYYFNDPAYFSEPDWLQAIFIFCFTLVTILGIGGNVIVCYIVLGNRRMRTVTNYFIANLAIGDALMATMCVNFTFYSTLYMKWPFGLLMCKLVSYTQSVAVSVSIFTIIAISLDRYTAIIHPLSPRMTATSTLLVVIFIWILAGLFALPTAMYTTVIDYGGGSTFCTEDWKHSYVYSIIAMIVQYFLPLIILGFAYGRIGHTIWARRTPGEGEASRDRKINESKTKLVKMFATVVLLFTLCYLPIHIFIIIQDVYPAILWYPFTKIIFLTVLLIAMSNCVYNPIIYCYMNHKFRNGFRGVFRFLPCISYDPEFTGFTGLKRTNTLHTHTENVSMNSRLGNRMQWANSVNRSLLKKQENGHNNLVIEDQAESSSFL